jgi:hypothetical protein
MNPIAGNHGKPEILSKVVEDFSRYSELYYYREVLRRLLKRL